MSTARDPFDLPQPDARVRVPRIARVPAVVARVDALNHDMREVVIRTADDAPPLYARAGQFLVLDVPEVGAPRSFSLARAPARERPREHTLLVRLVPGGAFSAWLDARDRTGSALEVAGPLGQFVRDQGTDPMLCIAGGSGISAIHALLEEAAIEAVERDAWLFLGARSQADLCLTDTLDTLARAWPAPHRLSIVPVLSEEPDDSDWSGARGLVTDHLAQAYLAPGQIDPRSLQAWLCGPPPMVAAAARVLSDAGAPAAAVHRDVFEDVRSPAPVIDNRRCVLCDECLLVRPVAGCIVEAAATEPGPDGRSRVTRPVTPSATSGLYYNGLVIDAGACIRCYACVAACPHGAIAPDYDPSLVTLRSPSPSSAS